MSQNSDDQHISAESTEHSNKRKQWSIVEVLSKYLSPLNIVLPTTTQMESSNPKFGKSLRQSDFLFDSNYLNMNHGSFGTFPKSVRTSLRSAQDACELRPDLFLRFNYPNLLDISRTAIATYLNTSADTVVLVNNATTALNTVLRGIEWAAGDTLIYFATVYGAIEKTIAYVVETTELQSLQIGYTYPVSDAWMVQALQDAIAKIRENGKTPKMALFDTVASQPGVRMPFEKLLKVCQEEGVLSCVDGAHGVGMLPPKELDLSVLNPDFFTSNLHKWFYVPRACAVLYVALKYQHLIRSTVPTSHGFEPILQPGIPKRIGVIEASAVPKSQFVQNFAWIGTLDPAPYLTIPDAMQFRERLGGDGAIWQYISALARSGGAHVAAKLGTVVMENEEGTLGNCAFSNVKLPLVLQDLAQLGTAAGQTVEEQNASLGVKVRDWMATTVANEHDAYIAFIFYADAFWVRLSAQVYLEMHDFERTADLILDITDRVKAGEFLKP